MDLGVIDVVAADTNVVTIGPGGGSVTDSQGLITLIIPPGALATPTPITVTPIQNREEMPAPLPTITLTEYGFDLEPSGTQLAQPATLLITNWRNAPTAAPIPAGTYDAVNGGWKHVAMATWNGSAWTYPIQHFSVHDLNADDFGEWVMVAGKGQDPNGGAQICGGSSISVSGGSVNQDIPLPTYRHSGRDYGVTLNYSSGLAGSRTLGTAPSSSAQAIPTTGVGVSVRAQSYQKMCLPQNAAPSVVAGNPGSCGLGACNLGEESTVTPWTFNVDWMGLQQSQTVNYPANASSIDVATWVDLPLGQDGTTTTGSGFVTQQITAGLSLQGSGSSPSCATLGTFGSPNFGQITPSNLQPGPALDVQRQVLVYHRHNSPFGAGWALEEIPRLFTAPGSPDYVTLVRGDGSEEDFRPRARVTTQVPNAGDTDYVFASDPATGDNLMANDEGDIVRLNGDGTTTGVLSGLSFDGPVQSLAVTYIGGQRNYLVALTTRLLWVAPDGSAQSVYTRSGNTLGSYLPAQVAARNDLAVYTEGLLTQPVLYRIRLSSPVGPPEAISSPQGSGDAGLDPTTTSVSGYSFYEPAGLAYAPTGELYVADSQRNAVMRVGLDMNGEIGPTSSIQHVVGDGAGRWVPDLGESFPGTQFPVNQPYFLSTSPDGTLLMASNYGVAALDPVSTQAEWIVFDQNTPGSDLSFRLFSIFSLFGSEYSNIAATGPRSFLAAPTASGTFPSLIDASLLGSDLNPTRTVTFSGVTATLVDATHALVENYDAQGRLTQRNLRTGEPLLSVAYADTASDRVSTVSDPDGGQTVFTYDPGTQKLSSMRDPAGRVTQFGRNSFGDLTSITEPDGEVLAFAYDGHHMTSKTARGSDTTTYVYRADGTLLSATKPAGETTTLTASLSSPAQYSTTGALIASGAYTDAHGVTHDFVTDPQGQIQTDDSTADGVAYARALVYDSQLDPLSTEFVPSTNANLLRVAYTTLNGVPLGLIVHHDTLGRVDQADGQVQGDHLYQYDSNGWLADVLVTPSDDDQRIVRDPAGHPLRIFDESAGVPSGREVDFTWGRIDGQPSAIVKHGVTYALSYDDSGGATRNLSGVVDTLGRTASFAYDASGNVAVASDGATTSSFAYDGNNRMLVAADALSNQTLFGYTQVNCGCSEADEVSSVHTPDLAAGAQWSLVYGAEGRLASVTDPDGHVESYGYEPTGELRALTDRDGNTTAVTHDQLGRVLTIVDALGRAHARAYPVPVQVNSVPPSASWVGPSLTSGSASGTAASADFTAALNAGDYQIGHNLYQPQGYPANVSFYRDATFQLSYIDQWDDARRPTRHRDRAGEPVSSTDITNATSSFLDETTGYSPFTSAPVVEDTDSPRPPNGADEGIFNHNVEFDLTDDTGYGASSSNDVTYTYGRDPGGRLTGVNRSWISIGAQFFTGPNQTYAYYPNGKLQTYTGPDGTKTLSYDTRGLLQRMTVALGSTVGELELRLRPSGAQRARRLSRRACARAAIRQRGAAVVALLPVRESTVLLHRDLRRRGQPRDDDRPVRRIRQLPVRRSQPPDAGHPRGQRRDGACRELRLQCHRRREDHLRPRHDERGHPRRREADARRWWNGGCGRAEHPRWTAGDPRRRRPCHQPERRHLHLRLPQSGHGYAVHERRQHGHRDVRVRLVSAARAAPAHRDQPGQHHQRVLRVRRGRPGGHRRRDGHAEGRVPLRRSRSSAPALARGEQLLLRGGPRRQRAEAQRRERRGPGRVPVHGVRGRVCGGCADAGGRGGPAAALEGAVVRGGHRRRGLRGAGEVVEPGDGGVPQHRRLPLMVPGRLSGDGRDRTPSSTEIHRGTIGRTPFPGSEAAWSSGPQRALLPWRLFRLSLVGRRLPHLPTPSSMGGHQMQTSRRMTTQTHPAPAAVVQHRKRRRAAEYESRRCGATGSIQCSEECQQHPDIATTGQHE